MFLAGDEFGNTQFGNNNAYCQDNEISWLDWNLLDKNRELFDFFKRMIGFRRAHPAVRRDLEPAKCGFPKVSTHTQKPWNGDITSETRVICVMYAGYDGDRGMDDIVYVAINVYWEEQKIILPGLSEGWGWQLYACTGQKKTGGIWDAMRMEPRSVAVWQAVGRF